MTLLSLYNYFLQSVTSCQFSYSDIHPSVYSCMHALVNTCYFFGQPDISPAILSKPRPKGVGFCVFFLIPLQLAPTHSVVVDSAPVPNYVGSLPVEWDLQRVGDMGVGVEVENWVEPSRPRNDREKLHDFIVQEGLLQLHPPVGRLGPGESTTWTILYRQACVAARFALHMSCTPMCADPGSLRTPSQESSPSCVFFTHANCHAVTLSLVQS